MNRSPSNQVIAIYNPSNGSIRILDAQTGSEISNLGQYSFGGIEGEEIKSVRFRGERIIQILDANGKVLHEIFLRPDYKFMRQEELFDSAEMALMKGFPV